MAVLPLRVLDYVLSERQRSNDTMSWNPALDPDIPVGDAVDAIDTVIIPRARDLGGFEVRRALPSTQRMVLPSERVTSPS